MFNLHNSIHLLRFIRRDDPSHIAYIALSYSLHHKTRGDLHSMLEFPAVFLWRSVDGQQLQAKLSDQNKYFAFPHHPHPSAAWSEKYFTSKKYRYALAAWSEKRFHAGCTYSTPFSATTLSIDLVSEWFRAIGSRRWPVISPMPLVWWVRLCGKHWRQLDWRH